MKRLSIPVSYTHLDVYKRQQYEGVVLGLIFLKYISDRFEQKFQELQGDEYADPEDNLIFILSTIPDKFYLLYGLKTLRPRLSPFRPWSSYTKYHRFYGNKKL